MIVRDSVYAIQRGYLDNIRSAKRQEILKEIGSDFKAASEQNNPTLVLHAYSRSKEFTTQMNSGMAENTYHELNFYCTPLNCNVLARTQDGIQVFIAILFHPRLNEQLRTGDQTVYRGTAVDSENVLKGYELGAEIITTTFLSTSKERTVAEFFMDAATEPAKPNQILLLCTYKLHNYRHTAVDMLGISQFPDEEEVLIYPYVSFRIFSYVKKTNEQTGKQQIEVELNQIGHVNIDDRKIQSI
jgi:hypothetical protein